MALTCNAKYKLQKKTSGLWGGFLDQKISQNRQLVNVKLVAQLKDKFRMESDVNCSHTQLPQLK